MEILTDKFTLPGTEDFGFEKHPDKLLKGQSIVGEEACHSKGGSTDHAQPACRIFPDDRMQQQIDTRCHCHGNHTAKELPDRKAEKDGFLVLGHFLGNFDFDRFHLLKVGEFDRNL